MTPTESSWDQMAALVLLLLSERTITPERAESWLRVLMEFAEVMGD